MKEILCVLGLLGFLVGCVLIGFSVAGIYHLAIKINDNKYQKLINGKKFDKTSRDLMKLVIGYSKQARQIANQLYDKKEYVQKQREKLPLSTTKERQILDKDIEQLERAVKGFQFMYEQKCKEYDMAEQNLKKFLAEKLTLKEQKLFRKHFYLNDD